MKRQLKQHNAGLKAKAALEAIENQRTVNEIAAVYGIHPNQVTQLKKQAPEQLPEIFSNKCVRSDEAQEELRSLLYQENGQLKEELEWLKKIGIEAGNLTIIIARECKLTHLTRSSYYYCRKGKARPTCA